MQHQYIVYNNGGSQIPSTPTVSYDDISANINQINDMINKGLYLEVIQECKNARDWHKLSPTDTNTINSLEATAQQKYDAYVEQQKQANKSKVVTDSQKRQIYEIVKKHVSMQLKSPSTAIWPDYTQLMYAYNAEGRISVICILIKVNIKASIKGRNENNRFCLYGSKMIKIHINRKYETKHSHKKIRRIMRSLGLYSVIRRKRNSCTICSPKEQAAENILNRDFSASQINQKWLTDVTEV